MGTAVAWTVMASATCVYNHSSVMVRCKMVNTRGRWGITESVINKKSFSFTIVFIFSNLVPPRQQ